MRKVAWMLAGVIAVVLMAEVVLRWLPVPTGMNLVRGYGTDKLLSYTPGSAITYSRDWDFLYARKGRINAFGYHGYCHPEIGTDKRRAVWVIGDSYAEALMVDESASLAAQLQSSDNAISVCTLGISGAPASEYLAMMDATPVTSGLTVWVVLLNTADIGESLGGRQGFHYLATNSASGEFSGKLRTVEGWLTIMNHSALFRYLNYSLDIKSTTQRLLCDLHLGCAKGGSVTNTSTPKTQFVHTADRLLNAMEQRANARSAKLIVVMNAFDPSILNTETRRRQEQLERTELLRQMAQRQIAVVDTQEVFNRSRACRQNGCYLFRDGHWSPTGHSELAAEVRRLLDP